MITTNQPKQICTIKYLKISQERKVYLHYQKKLKTKSPHNDTQQTQGDHM